ncbi:carbon-nitrogen hydrolase family protein [Aestuariicoccus sp. MJ-SS9]|uniref:carbon-nitrogen hydrolase family protein n=1 Tax=Aestuariicoccus sp. MJ-SS9 TaxID=3079855 RepID=UPI0029142698|nr:carbon-nitrogen hydrolase family protein [Aestuariicoccus sp. MJ-SS9]MDU8912999.1 carbon-nitrogen hydrolase family protein [Aestuariicoccus sp. MJ-SS9]
MKIATAAYAMDFLDNWQAYADKLGRWVGEAAGQGAELLVFPEYGAMELATLAGRDVALDLEGSLHAVSARIDEADALHSDLATRHGVHILAASGPVFDDALGPRPVNRARLFTPTGACGIQDKQIMTRFERETWHVVPGGPLQIFDTSLGRIGILICYDSEFPLLGRALAQADIILVPSCTEALTGYSRVRIGAMARALENQCVTVMASTVGPCDWSEAVDQNTGMGGVFGPPDIGFPPTGILAEGVLNRPGWTYADVDPARIAHVRRDGVVLNRSHWTEQTDRIGAIRTEMLR